MDFDLASTIHSSEKANVGDIIELEDGIRKKYNGSTWRRLCSKSICEHYMQRQGLCKLHLDDLKKRKTSKVKRRKRRSVPKPNRRLSIANIPESVDIDHPNKGDMIEMENGSHKKFDGVVWRTICSIENCFIAAQRNELCRKHYFQSSRKKSTNQKSTETSEESAEYDEKSCSDNESHSSTVPLNRDKFPTIYLKEWLREHRSNPYPTVEEKLELARQSSITYEQVEHWFNDARLWLRQQQQHDQSTKVRYRSVGVQCNPTAADQTTATSTITDEQIQTDRTIKVLTSSIESLSPKIQFDDIYIEDDDKPVIVTSTCLNDNQMSRLRDFCSKFHIEFCNYVNEHTTHLITDEDDDRTLVCPLSKKVIQAIARHMYIVTYRWIDDCLKLEQIINEKPYEIQGDLTLSSDHHGMQRSRQSILSPYFPRNNLLQNYWIMLKCDGCQNLLNNDELTELIQLAGAKYMTDSHFSRWQTGIQRIVLCEKEYLIHRREMYEKCVQAGIHFLTPEWFLETLVQYRIQPFQEYQLSP